MYEAAHNYKSPFDHYKVCFGETANLESCVNGQFDFDIHVELVDMHGPKGRTQVGWFIIEVICLDYDLLQ